MARILHLDDVEMIHDVVRRILEAYGHKLVWASDGDEALRRIRSDWQSLELLLMDVYHPGSSASEVVQAALACEPPMPVVICSDSMTLDSLRGYFPEGGIRYLAKPFLAQELLEVVDEALAPFERT